MFSAEEVRRLSMNSGRFLRSACWFLKISCSQSEKMMGRRMVASGVL